MGTLQKEAHICIQTCSNNVKEFTHLCGVSVESRLSNFASGGVNPSTSFEQGLYVIQTFVGTSSLRSIQARPEWSKGREYVCAISQLLLNYMDEVIRARTRVDGQEVWLWEKLWRESQSGHWLDTETRVERRAKDNCQHWMQREENKEVLILRSSSQKGPLFSMILSGGSSPTPYPTSFVPFWLQGFRITSNARNWVMTSLIARYRHKNF